MNLAIFNRIVFVLGLLPVLYLMVGCGSVQVSPWWFSHKISSTDHVVVTNCLAGTAPPWAGLPQYPYPDMNYSPTITGPEVKEIVHAISTMHTEVDLSGQAMSATFYEWHLQFYRGKKFLGDVGLSGDLVECGDYEYPSPPVLKKLYARIEHQSGAVPNN